MNANQSRAKSTRISEEEKRCTVLLWYTERHGSRHRRWLCRSNKTQHGNRADLKNQSLKHTFGRKIDFHHALNELFKVCRPTMKVSIGDSHSSNILGVSNNLHFTEFFTIFRDQGPPRIMVFVASLNPAAFTKSQVGANNAVDSTECRCPCKHQLSKRWWCISEILSVRTLCKLQGLQIVDVPEDNWFLKPLEDRVKRHCKQKAIRKTTLSYTSGHQELSSSCSHKFHVCNADPRVMTLRNAAAKNTWIWWSTHNVAQSSGLNLKDVVCHLPRGDSYLREVNALHSEQVHQVIEWSSRSSVSEVLGIKTVLFLPKKSGTLHPSNTAW